MVPPRGNQAANNEMPGVPLLLFALLKKSSFALKKP
jgi:hypothetical protein